MLQALWVGLIACLLAGAVFAGNAPVPDTTRASVQATNAIQGDCGKRVDMASCNVTCLASAACAPNAITRFSAPSFREMSFMPAPSLDDEGTAPEHAPPKRLST
jgi:hypothetical protein